MGQKSSIDKQHGENHEHDFDIPKRTGLCSCIARGKRKRTPQEIRLKLIHEVAHHPRLYSQEHQFRTYYVIPIQTEDEDIRNYLLQECHTAQYLPQLDLVVIRVSPVKQILWSPDYATSSYKHWLACIYPPDTKSLMNCTLRIV